MNNFERLTKDADTLGAFLRTLPVLEGPWDAEFHARFCAGCAAENCDACPHEEFRNNPGWWLTVEAGGGIVTAARRAFGKISWVMLTFILTGALISPTFGGGQEPKEQPTARPRNLEVVSISYTQPPKETETKAEYIPPAADVEALAKMLYGEARGVASDTEKAACVWVVLNRVDDPRYPDTVLEVLESPAQFAGYNPNNPVTEELKTLAADVLTRHHAEETGAADVGRVIPREYLFFTGDGKQNHFTKEWKSAEAWGWTLESPYDTERAVQ